MKYVWSSEILQNEDLKNKNEEIKYGWRYALRKPTYNPPFTQQTHIIKLANPDTYKPIKSQVTSFDPTASGCT